MLLISQKIQKYFWNSTFLRCSDRNRLMCSFSSHFHIKIVKNQYQNLFFLLDKHFFRTNIKMPPTSTHLKYWKTQEPKYNNPVCKHALFDIWLTDVFLFFLSPSLPLNRLVHMARLCHERIVKLQYSILNNELLSGQAKPWLMYEAGDSSSLHQICEQTQHTAAKLLRTRPSHGVWWSFVVSITAEQLAGMFLDNHV